MNIEAITFHTKRAQKYWSSQKEKDTPIELLEAALNKLRHENLDLAAIAIKDYDTARELASEIKTIADELESDIYHQKKNLKDLTGKGKIR